MTSPKLFDVLKIWCDAHKVKVDVDNSIGIVVEFNSEKPDALVLTVKSGQDEPVMLHEASHAYLYFQRKSGRLDAKSEKQLDDDIKAIREAEPKLGQKEQDALKKIFGPASGYSDPSLGPEPTEYSFIGNLVDETRTFKAGTRYAGEGHPMSNFDEFCASLCATASYGDFEKFARQMQQFGKAAAELPALAPLYEKTLRVLASAVEQDAGFANVLRALNGFRPEPAELMNMELNLAKMRGLLQELAQMELPAGRTGIETARR
ncbi:MAG: hypothetical protein M1530_03065 [Candidatus Marsarchaeota archaeon]|nr:hypothetical protein [Candidatus Marsarchaeota archaeon]